MSHSNSPCRSRACRGQFECHRRRRGVEFEHASRTGAAPSPPDWRSHYRALHADRMRHSSARNRAKSSTWTPHHPTSRTSAKRSSPTLTGGVISVHVLELADCRHVQLASRSQNDSATSWVLNGSLTGRAQGYGGSDRRFCPHPAAPTPGDCQGLGTGHDDHQQCRSRQPLVTLRRRLLPLLAYRQGSATVSASSDDPSHGSIHSDAGCCWGYLENGVDGPNPSRRARQPHC